MRQRDIKLLFEDAATGARSPAFVPRDNRETQCKPEQRRGSEEPRDVAGGGAA